MTSHFFLLHVGNCFFLSCVCVDFGVVCVVNLCSPKLFPITVVWYFYFDFVKLFGYYGSLFFFLVTSWCLLFFFWNNKMVVAFWWMFLFEKLLFISFESMISSVHYFFLYLFFSFCLVTVSFFSICELFSSRFSRFFPRFL